MNDSNAGADDSLEHALAAAVDQYGPNVLHDTARLRTALAKAAPHAMPQIGALLAAVAQRVPHAMLAAANEDEMAGAMPSLVDRMMSLRTLKRDQAIWVVRTWANALAVPTRGLDLDSGEPTPERAVAADTRSSVAEVVLGTRHAADASAASPAPQSGADAAVASSGATASLAKPEPAPAPVPPSHAVAPVEPASESSASADESLSLDAVMRRRRLESEVATEPAPTVSAASPPRTSDPESALPSPARAFAAKPVAPGAGPAEPVFPNGPAPPGRLDPTLPLGDGDETIIHRPRRVRQPDPDETVLHVPAWAEDPVAAKRAGAFPNPASPDDAKPRDVRRRGMPLMIVGAIAAVVVIGMVAWQRWSSSEPSEANVSTANVPAMSPPAAPNRPTPDAAPKIASAAPRDGGVQASSTTTDAPPPPTAPNPSKPADTPVATTAPADKPNDAATAATSANKPGAVPVAATTPASKPDDAAAATTIASASPTTSAAPGPAPSQPSAAPAASAAKVSSPAPARKTAPAPPPKVRAPAPSAKTSTAARDKPSNDKAANDKAAPRSACTPSTCGIVVSSLPSSEPGLFEMVIRLDDRSIRSFTYAIRIKAGVRVRKSGSRYVAAG